jgi:hypothetical protein
MFALRVAIAKGAWVGEIDARLVPRHVRRPDARRNRRQVEDG